MKSNENVEVQKNKIGYGQQPLLKRKRERHLGRRTIVLSTKEGIEGINLKYKNPPFIVDSKNGQINKLKFILKNNNKIKKISKKNKLYYKKLYSMNNITNKFLRKFI